MGSFYCSVSGGVDQPLAFPAWGVMVVGLWRLKREGDGVVEVEVARGASLTSQWPNTTKCRKSKSRSSCG